MLVTIKSNQACLNAPFGSILLTFEGDELVRCELSEEAVEEDLGSFAEHKAVKALKSYLGGSVQAWTIGSPVRTARNFAVRFGRRLQVKPVIP